MSVATLLSISVQRADQSVSAGPNKNRVFWLCARPVGEGYDKGQPKADVNPEFRCNYFK
jgi:hypothetical protein